MILFHNDPQADQPKRIIMVFGVGLIGTPLCEMIVKTGGYRAYLVPYKWDFPEDAEGDREHLHARLRQIIEEAANPGGTVISVVWSAGKSGFGAGPQETANELISYKGVLGIVQRVLKEFPFITCLFHLVSSAGGLFEGARIVSSGTHPKPMRHYGNLKLTQEQILKQCESIPFKHIYRPTSVYGYYGEGKRMGLISALVLGGIQNRVSTIYGTMNTLRDYVFSRDIAVYIARKLFARQDQDGPIIHHLATGKPSSVFEIQQIIERSLGKKLLLQFQSDDDIKNISDVSIHPDLLPDDWVSVDIRTGIGYLTERMIAEDEVKI